MRQISSFFLIVSVTMVSFAGCKGEPKATQLKPNTPQRHAELLTDVERLIASGKDINIPQAFCDPNWPYGEVFNKKAERSMYTPLHIAVMYGSVDAAAMLVENEADLEVRDHAGATPLHRVAQKGYADTMALLLDAGADVNARADGGSTPIYWASSRDYAHLEMFKLLLDAGANVNIFTDSGYTPLHDAVDSTTEIVELLIKHGADVNASGRSGYTPLHAATAGADIGVLEVLLANGANINAKDSTGRTPLGEARYHIKSGAPTTTTRQKKIIRFLGSKGATE